MLQKEKIENSMGQSLLWQRLEGKRACRIAFEMTNGGYRDDEANWELIQIPMIDAMIQFAGALEPSLKKLNSIK